MPSETRSGRAPALSVARWPAALALVLALAGYLVVAQVRTEWQIRRTLRIPSTQLEELAFLLRDQERGRAALESQVAELRGRLVAYERASAESRTTAAKMSRDLQELRTLAGITALVGPGITVELNDSTRPPRAGEDPNKTILHYSDIQGVVSELWAAGAEAIALNGERIVGTSGISCVGTTILTNTKRMAPPYLITAVGESKQLVQALRRPGGAIELLTAFGFPVKVAPRDLVEVPPYRGTFRFEYASVEGKE